MHIIYMGSFVFFFNDVYYLVQLLVSELLFFSKKSKHTWIGIIEILANNIFQGKFLVLFPTDNRKVPVHISCSLMIKEFLFFEYLNHCRHAVIMRFRIGQ